MNATSKIKSNNQISSDEVISHIGSVGSNSFTIKAVFSKNWDSAWSLIIGMCDVGSQEKSTSIIYSDYAFVIKRFENCDINSIIHEINKFGIVVCDDPVLRIKSVNNPKWEWELIPSHATQSGYPIYKYISYINRDVNFFDIPLIGYDLPFYESSNKYIKEFMCLENFYGSGDVNKGSFFINIINHGNRLFIHDHQLLIESTLNGLCVVGCSKSRGNFLMHKDDVVLLGDEELAESELWLVTNKNEILDYRSQLTWPYNVRNDKEKNIKEVLYSLIDQGEGQHCEFKSYIDVTQESGKKAYDLEKTVCAFSNASGGKLLVGVNDDGTLDGLDEKLCKVYKSSIGNALDGYCNDIKKRLYETLFVSQCYEIFPVKLGAVYIVVISVVSSKDPNYVRSDKQAYLRKGATSAKMAFADERKDYQI